MRKLLILLLVLMMGCSSSNSNKADMSGYEGFNDDKHVFVESVMKEVSEKMDKGETFAVYFGFSRCPWCVEAVPIINEVAKEYKATVLYVNTRKNEEWKSNIDIDDYDLFIEKFGDYVPLDENNIKHLYTPHIFFIKDGKVVSEHAYTVDGHDAHERKLTEEEIEEVKGYYKEGFEAMK